MRTAKGTIEVSIEGEANPLLATAEHPFFVSRARGDLSHEGGAGGNWIPAGELEAGDRVRRPSGEWAQVTQIERHEGRVQVYNFEVADNHNYFVGKSGVLVHNDYLDAVEQLYRGQLQPTHGLTRSRRQMDDLVDSIAQNGIQDPIKYVEDGGVKYIVDGHHRLEAARRLGMSTVPAQRVDLPFMGYRTIADLFPYFPPGY